MMGKLLWVFGFRLQSLRLISFKVYNVYPTTEEHVEIIQQLESQDDYDFWSDLRQIGDAVQIMVPPTKQKEFERFLSFQQIQFTGMIDDVQKYVKE